MRNLRLFPRSLFVVPFLAAAACSAAPSADEHPRHSRPSALAVGDASGVGLNAGSLEFGMGECPDPASQCGPLDDVLGHLRALGVTWLRLELSDSPNIDRSTPQQADPRAAKLDYWKAVVSRLQAAGVRVLGAVNNTLVPNQSATETLDATSCDPSTPGPFGYALVTDWLPVAERYIDALPYVTDWEIWNEANDDRAPNRTYLCAASYALVLSQLNVDRPGAAIGPSIITGGNAPAGPDPYATQLDAASLDSGGNVPWTRVYHHVYPNTATWDLTTDLQMLSSTLGAPLWTTELGFQVDPDEATQASNLETAYDVILNQGNAEKVFWFALNDCAQAGTFGLVQGCPFRGAPRVAYAALQRMARGCDTTDRSSDASNCGACGVACRGSYTCTSGQCTPTQCSPEIPTFPVAGCTDVAPAIGASYAATSNWTVQGGSIEAAGNACSNGWNAGGYAPAWWQVDLGSPRPVRGVTLLPGMLPDGDVHHAVDVSLDGSTWQTVKDISQFMANGAPYPFDFGAPIAARFVRVRTLASPSWISWEEVGVFVCP